MSTIPIICLALADQPHRFTVAEVTTDLRCTSCGSNDIDLDEVTAAKTAAGAIQWTGDTHLGVGYIVGLAANDDVYEVYFNPNMNPTPCAWAQYGPEGDTGLGSQKDRAGGFTTMQEAMKAAEVHAAGKTAKTSAWAGDGSDGMPYVCEDCGKWRNAQNSPHCEAAKTIAEADGKGRGSTLIDWLAHGLFPSGASASKTADYVPTGKIVTTSCDVCGAPVEFAEVASGPFTAMDPANGDGSGSDYLGTWCAQHVPSRRSSAKTADFNDPEMAEVGDTSTVTQKATCSSCLSEHTVTAVDPAQPMPACPSCGKDTLSPAGATLARRRAANERMSNPDYAAGYLNGSQDAARGGKFDLQNYYESSNSDFAEGYYAGFDGWTTPGVPPHMLASRRTAAGRKTANSYDRPETFVCTFCHAGYTDPEGYAAAFGTDSGEEMVQHMVDVHGYNRDTHEMTGSSRARVEAKVRQIADGVLATNPGMNRTAALEIAAKTLTTYPAMLRETEGN